MQRYSAYSAFALKISQTLSDGRVCFAILKYCQVPPYHLEQRIELLDGQSMA